MYDAQRKKESRNRNKKLHTINDEIRNGYTIAS